MKSYIKVYMDSESNKRMFAGETVTASLEPIEGYMELTVGRYRVEEMKHNKPFVLVEPASNKSLNSKI